MGDEGGEPVVVAEADLVRGDGVVLVDDGDGAHGQELVQGPVGVAVVGAAAGVVARSAAPGRPGVRSARRRRCSGRPAAPGRRWRRPAAGPGRVGRRARPSGASPAAMAPEETSTISLRRAVVVRLSGLSVRRPACLASTSTRASTRSASSPPAAVVSEEEPTLTTTRRACATSSRAPLPAPASAAVLLLTFRCPPVRSLCAPVRLRTAPGRTTPRPRDSARTTLPRAQPPVHGHPQLLALRVRVRNVRQC